MGSLRPVLCPARTLLFGTTAPQGFADVGSNVKRLLLVWVNAPWWGQKRRHPLDRVIAAQGPFSFQLFATGNHFHLGSLSLEINASQDQCHLRLMNTKPLEGSLLFMVWGGSPNWVGQSHQTS